MGLTSVSAREKTMLKKRLIILALSLALAAGLVTVRRAGPDPARGAGEGETAKSSPAVSKPASRPVRPRRRGRRSAMTAEQKEELKKFAAEHMPELWEQYQQLQKDDARQARRLLSRIYWLWRRVRRYPEGEVRDAAVARQHVSVEIYKVLRAYRKAADDAERAKLRKQLTDLEGQRFDYDLVVKTYDVKRLQERLSELKAEIKRRRSERANVIKASVERLTRRRAAATRPAKQTDK